MVSLVAVPLIRQPASYDASLPLRAQVVQPRTAQRYRLSFRHFKSFIWSRHRLQLSSIPESQLDAYFEEFVDATAKRFHGAQRQRCVLALQGVFLVMGEHLRT